MVWIVIENIEDIKEEKNANEVLMVKEYVDVFPNDLPGLPPNMEIEFTINIILGTEPISRPLYRMAPTKLKKAERITTRIIG